jgi:phosphatidylglycerophosphatase A
LKRIALLIATVGGAGYVPLAPGTVGSAVGVLVYLATRDAEATTQVILFTAICLVGTWASTIAARHFGRDDPSHVVVDEVAGQLATFLLLDVGVAGALTGFLLFRLMDVIKPWPANRLEALPAGFGVMADDLMAGAYGWLVLLLLIQVVPGLR